MYFCSEETAAELYVNGGIPATRIGGGGGGHALRLLFLYTMAKFLVHLIAQQR
jgi:hypothetical protein